MLSRKVVTRRGRHFRGYYPSRKLGRMVAWESLLERDAVLLLEFSPGVVSYREQPSVIQYWDGCQQRDYYPDFELVLTNGQCIDLEIKSSTQLAKPKVEAKFRAIASRYSCFGKEFRIATELEIRRVPLLSNVRTLHSLLRRSVGILLPAADLIRLLGQGARPLEQFESYLGRETTWCLLAAGHLICDLEQPITKETLVRVNTGGGHAAVLL